MGCLGLICVEGLPIICFLGVIFVEGPPYCCMMFFVVPFLAGGASSFILANVCWKHLHGDSYNWYFLLNSKVSIVAPDMN